MSRDKAQAKITLLIGIALLLLIVLAAAQQLPLQSPPALNASISLAHAQDLAALNGRALDDYGRGYLAQNNYFADLEYMPVKSGGLPLRMMIGNRQDDLKGINVGGKHFAVQLMACDWQERVCGFRINGVPTGAMGISQGAASEFLLDQDHKLVLKDAQFDFCDHRRFCNVHFEAYDIVDAEIERR